ncbi:protein CUSTOS [Engraulis encrasicolus]|uniref:protein CUSTOS n=1 Tax=Engraulis encrasicolus TaxID=184585 RepID=UPI002FD28F87
MSSDSSSEEDTEKLKEATWSFGPAETNGCQTEQAKNGTKSRRAVVSEHEHDGNELQTTPEFRAHVAKKLGAVLDGCISEVSKPTVGCSNSPSWKEKEEDEDEGFLLFSTSVPGSSEPPPAPSLKRRPAPSSSDSDSEKEMRFKQAAVTISDIVRPYYAEKTVQNTDSAVDAQESKGDASDGLVTKKKKKKKKKKNKVPQVDDDTEKECQESPGDANTQEHDAQENTQPAKLKKKKKNKVPKVDEGNENECGDANTGTQKHDAHENTQPAKLKKKKKKKADLIPVNGE